MKDLRMSLNAYFYFSQGYYYGAGYFACIKLSSPEKMCIRDRFYVATQQSTVLPDIINDCNIQLYSPRF